MQNHKSTSSNNFEADEVLKNSTLQQENKILEENLESGKEELKPIKFYKTYELNDEGLRLYGMYKKQQHLNIIKWSLLGTCLGCLFAAAVDLSFKKMKYSSKDFLKTFILLGNIGFFTYYGIQAGSIQFRAKQRELSQLYGREVEESERES